MLGSSRDPTVGTNRKTTNKPPVKKPPAKKPPSKKANRVSSPRSVEQVCGHKTLQQCSSMPISSATPHLRSGRAYYEY